MELAVFLKEVPLFANMAEETLKRLSERTRFYDFDKGEVIIREGEVDNRLFVLIEGQCSAVIGLGEKNERHLETFRRYSYFGEMALIDELSRSASVVAETDVKALSIDKPTLNLEIQKNPEIAFDLLRTLSLRVRALNMTILSNVGTRFPICLKCYKMQDANNQWVSVETFMRGCTETQMNQPICPECHGKYFSPI